MATIARLSVDLIANSATFRKDLDKAGKRSDRVFNNMQKKAKMAGAAFMAAGAGAALAFGKGAVTAMGDFEEALADVRAKTDGTARQIDDLANSMRSAAKVTKFTAVQTAEAGTFLAQAGLSISEINAALRPTLDLAAATKTSVQNTADFMTNIMKGMGMTEHELARASDVLAVTTAKSNTNLTDLALAMSYAAPSARAMGMSIEETSALIGMMANAGIKGSVAGTALRATFGYLANQGELTEAALAGMTGGMTKQQTVLKRLGVHTYDAGGNIRNLVDLLHDLKKAGGNESDMIAIFGRRAGSAMMQFMNEGLEGAGELQLKLDGARGAAERMANVQLDSLNGDILLMKSQFTELQLIFADNGLNEFMRSMTQSVTSFLKQMEPKIKWLGENLPQIGIALAGLASPFILTGLAVVTKMLYGMATAAMANPYVLAGIAIAAFAVVAYNNFGRIKVFMHNIFMVSIPKMFVHLQMAMQKLKLGLLKVVNSFLNELAVKINIMINLYNKIPFVDQKEAFVFSLDTTSTEDKLKELKIKLDDLENRRQTFTPEVENEELDDTREPALVMPDSIVDAIKGQFDDLKGFQADYYKSTKDMATGSWGDLIDAGSKGSKKLLMIKRAFALKNIIIAGAEALAEAAKLPFPANIAAGIKAAAGTALQIQSVQGQFHDGIDDVPNTGTYLLEQGERVVDNRLNKDLTNFLAANGSSTTTNSPTLNFNVNGGDEEGVRKVLNEKRGEFESMIRSIYNENAQNAPF
tara:strand:- start:11525 stop:13789 length:2265 start_codon:yes stop_codon:yes gene_type:complete